MFAVSFREGIHPGITGRGFASHVSSGNPFPPKFVAVESAPKTIAITPLRNMYSNHVGNNEKWLPPLEMRNPTIKPQSGSNFVKNCLVFPGYDPSSQGCYMGVSKNRGTPKWMVKIMENPIKVDDMGGKPTILGNPTYHS